LNGHDPTNQALWLVSAKFFLNLKVDARSGRGWFANISKTHTQQCFAFQPFSAQRFSFQLLHWQAQAVVSAARTQQMPRPLNKSGKPKHSLEAPEVLNLKTLRTFRKRRLHRHD